MIGVADERLMELEVQGLTPGTSAFGTKSGTITASAATTVRRLIPARFPVSLTLTAGLTPMISPAKPSM
jgi:hypothetical protein